MMQDVTPQTHASSRGSGLRIILSILLATLLLGIGFAGGIASAGLMNARTKSALVRLLPERLALGESTEENGESYALLKEIRAILDDEYVDPSQLDDKELLHGAADGMVAAVGDPHTSFVEPVSAAIMQEDMQGTFEGIGASVEMVDGRLTIVRPLPNSPALEAGLQANDVILEADGQSLEGMDVMEAIVLIRGPEGTTVDLLIERESVEEPFLVTVERTELELPNVESRMLEDGKVAYVSLAEFNALSAKQLRETLQEVLAQNPEGLILDLRANPGGYLHIAVDVASEFLPKGTLLLTEEERDKEPQEYRAERGGLAAEIPLVVLVDGASASASEIVAGALQDHERATLVGQPTYGKGSVQKTHTLLDESNLRVTIAKWRMPDGQHLDGVGISPDVDIALTSEDVAQDRDPQLDKAIEILVDEGTETNGKT